MSRTAGAKALQFHYTSCRRGLSGYAGFQTRAESAGLRLEERRELEAKALYQPPRDLPREPDAETIAARFPTAFRTVSLTSGRQALIRAVYSGQDYSGRWGNYFAHALVLDEIADGRWPIDAFAWKGWLSGVADDDSEPAPLQEVPVDQITAGTDFSFQELKTFLHESEDRPRALETMLRAVFRRKADSRSLVIRERLELDGLYWVACIQKAFPPLCQRELSCSTFQFDPRSSLAVNVTVGDTDFLFDEGERKYQFYIFDFATGVHSSVPEEWAEYAQSVSAWMAADTERIEGFHEFAALFKDLEIDSGLLHVLRLYRLEAQENVALNSADLTSILEFVHGHARPAAFAWLLRAVEQLARALDQRGRPEDWAAVVRFLAEGAVATGEAEHRLRACQLWREAFDTFVITRQSGEELILSLRLELEKALAGGARLLSEEFLADAHMDWLLARAPKLPAKSLGILMNAVDRSCRQIGNESSYDSQPARNLVEAVLVGGPQPPDLQWALAPYRSSVEGLAAMSGHIADVLSGQGHSASLTKEQWSNACRAVGGSLGSVLASVDRSLRLRLIAQLKKEERFAPVLFGEWESVIQRAPDKIEAQTQYELDVLSDDSKFAAEMSNRMAAALLRILPAEAQRAQARRWVESERTRRFSDDVARQVLALALPNVTFAPEDVTSKDLAARIVAQLSARDLNIDTVRLRLREAACRALTEPDGINGMRSVVTSADPDSYREFVYVVLPRLLSGANTRSSHRRAVMVMAREPGMDAFAERYCSLLFQRSGETLNDADSAALTFWLKLEETDSAWPLLGPLHQRALDTIVERIRSMPKKIRTRIESALENLDEMKGPAGHKALEAFLERVRAKKPSWFSKLLSD